MSDKKFSRPVSLTLTGPDAVREYVAGPRHNDWASVYSDWIVALIQEIRQSQYPYNCVVQREAEKRLGLPRFDDNGSTLSGLVYSCQQFADEEKNIRNGFQLVSNAFLEQAYNAGGKITVLCDGLIGGRNEKPYCVKKSNDGYVVRPPRARTKRLWLGGNVWAKVAT